MQFLTINNTKNVPIIGLGTYKLRGFDLCFEVFENALKIGYRVFDTAQVYKNESDIGRSLEILLPKYNLKRDNIFLITKIATSNHAEKCMSSILESLANLKIDYVDLILIHWPGVKGFKPNDPRNFEKRKETWFNLEQAYLKGLTKFIGVSNYNIRHLDELFEYATIKPHWLQSEFHPMFFQKDLLDYCRLKSIVFQAYSSLGTSDKKLNVNLINNQKVIEIGKKHSKTPVQVLLRWSVEQNIGVIPKSLSNDHLKENFEIFDFSLSNEDILELNSLNKNENLCWNPNTVF